MKNIETFYKTMYKIRRFEETLLKLFSENKLKGTTHTCIGQEAVAVSVMSNLRDEDYVFSNHRCHGHFIAYSDNIKILLAEIMGTKAGMCKGRGGSQHISYKHFYTNGVQGGGVPDATGVAWAQKIQNKDAIAVVFLGDGTLGQGVVYESLNLASLYKIPILYVVEENGYAMTTSVKSGVAGNILDRAKAFAIQAAEVTSNDVEILDEAMKQAFSYVRLQRKPFFQVIHTYRLGPHSKGDDYRDPEEIARWKENDPLKILGARLEESTRTQIQDIVEKEIQNAVEYASQQEIDQSINDVKEDTGHFPMEDILNRNTHKKCVESLREGIKKAMEDFGNSLLIGEDIRDPYGGSFKVTKGLSTLFSSRVINTPISEAGFIGLGIGLAMAGMKPIVEMMFGDFLTLGFDQILNHATKFHWMYAEQVKVPLLIRAPMGGGRGYGATHSQSLEKYFIGIPNLRVVAPSRFVDVGKLIYHVLQDIDSPVLFIENKKMYAESLYMVQDGKWDIFSVTASDKLFPVVKLTIDSESIADAVIVTYGAMADTAIDAAKKLMFDDEIMVDIVVNTSISPMNMEENVAAIGKVKNILTLEEGTVRAGWGAEMISELAKRGIGEHYEKVGTKNCVIPCGAELEAQILPNAKQVIDRIRSMCNE